MSAVFERFGTQVWQQITALPFGSLTKREIEIVFLRAAIESGLLDPRPEIIATMCKISLSKAHGYLTDLALRQMPLNDVNAVKRLIASLKDSEVVRSESHLSIPLDDAELRIWLERKMTILRLNSGDTLRRDHVKLTPSGLAKLLGASEGILSPYDALNNLPKELQMAEWANAAKKSWKKGTTWPEALEMLGNTVTIMQAVIPVLLGSVGA
ncbi:hypothetical protein [Calditerrivibrio nitroreducens]|uniref:Uncharacterized protein n=1 Tax=Calditerrivibrio nitroreducens (strain DSM 19672 / NBRC 101217 / Yu37-1) TaxID=768670 RepID=E4TIL8_CALNY|nr:hypothetical protein [Calditerrivibrio nitroreducens]ADR19066.1 hypothetical protein Calni_1157 [Calditerrivibrio nitroreducens DSM 19672]